MGGNVVFCVAAKLICSSVVPSRYTSPSHQAARELSVSPKKLAQMPVNPKHRGILDKIGHPIVAVRARSANNVLFKLNNGLLMDSDLVQDVDFLHKLFPALLLKPGPDDEADAIAVLESFLCDTMRILVRLGTNQLLQEWVVENHYTTALGDLQVLCRAWLSGVPSSPPTRMHKTFLTHTHTVVCSVRPLSRLLCCSWSPPLRVRSTSPI